LVVYELKIIHKVLFSNNIHFLASFDHVIIGEPIWKIPFFDSNLFIQKKIEELKIVPTIIDMKTPPHVVKSIFDLTTELLPNTHDSTESHADIIDIPVLEINILEDEFNTTDLEEAETKTSDKPTTNHHS